MTNSTNKYQTPVGLQQPAAADLSDGTTGTGAVVQAGSPTLTGAPLAPTATTGDNTTKLATTAFVTTAITNAVAGINPAVAVQAASAAILPNSPTYLNGASGIGATITAGSTNVTLVVDGYTPILNDRILVKNESDGGGLGAGKNGVYFVSQLAGVALAWILTRALDYDQPSDINSTGAIPVINGTVNTTTQWVLTSSITAVDGTQALTYAQFSANPSTLAPLNSPAFTGTPTAPTPSALDNSTKLATTAYDDAAVAVEKARALAAEALLAPLASPALTGSPTAPTQTSTDNTTKIATDAFVQTAVSGLTKTIASGTASLGTGAIASGAKASTVTVSAVGTLTTDTIMADFNADPTAVTGYVPSTSGILTIIKFPTADHVNFIVINNTGGSITPGAITLNWRVVR